MVGRSALPNSEIALSFYGGVEGEIGGNSILLRVKNGDTHYDYIFDLGVNRTDWRKHLAAGGKLKTIEQYERWGFIPPLEDLIPRACFVSHAHPDHWQALPALLSSKYRQPRAIWASGTTSTIINLGRKGPSRIPMTSKRFYPEPFGKDYYHDYTAEAKGVDVSVAAFPVDHSIPGACSYLIKINKTVIIYTGDFRDHGILSEDLKQQFWDYSERELKRKARDLILICEGTNYGTAYYPISERDVYDEVQETIRRYRNEAILAVVSSTDYWRIYTICKAVSDLKQEFPRRIIFGVALDKKVEAVRQAIRKDYSEVISEQNLDRYARIPKLRINESLYPRIRYQPQKYFIVSSWREGFRIADRLGPRAISGGCCILSLSEKLEEEVGISTRDYARRMSRLGISIEEFHASGHIYPSKLVQIIKSLHPNRIFPIHTSGPDGLKRYIKRHVPDVDVTLPRKGEEIVLS